MNKYHKNLLCLNIMFCIATCCVFFVYKHFANKYQTKNMEATLSQEVEAYQKPENKHALEGFITDYDKLLLFIKDTLSRFSSIMLMCFFISLINIILIILGRQRKVVITDQPNPSATKDTTDKKDGADK